MDCKQQAAGACCTVCCAEPRAARVCWPLQRGCRVQQLVAARGSVLSVLARVRRPGAAMYAFACRRRIAACVIEAAAGEFVRTMHRAGRAGRTEACSGARCRVHGAGRVHGGGCVQAMSVAWPRPLLCGTSESSAIKKGACCPWRRRWPLCIDRWCECRARVGACVLHAFTSACRPADACLVRWQLRLAFIVLQCCRARASGPS